MKRSFHVALGFLVAAAIGLAVSSCAPFLDSPYSSQLLHPTRKLNSLSQEKLGDVEADGVIRFAVFSDSHQNYKDLDQVIYAINATDGLDFAAYLGDLTNGGYNFEYDQFLDSAEYLHAPLLTAIGNHDAIGAGPELFRRAFGDSNFYFESASHRFIFFNSVGLEDPNDFDPTWLKDRVEESTKPVIIFSHVSLRDPERFFGETAATFDAIIKNSKTQLILNGHNHTYWLVTDNGTILLQAARTEGKQWLIVEIQGSQLTIRRMDSGEVSWFTLK